MSSIGDSPVVLELAESIIDTCREGPEEYRKVCKDVEYFRTALQSIADNKTNLSTPTEKEGNDRNQDLKQTIINCEGDLRRIQQLIGLNSRLDDSAEDTADRVNPHRTWHSYQVGSEDLANARRNLTSHTSTIMEFADGPHSPIEDTIATSASRVASNPEDNNLSEQMTHLSTTQSRNFELHTQGFGKSSFNFRIDSMQHGTYRSQPACLCLLDIWFESHSGYELSSGELMISTYFKGSSDSIAPFVPAFSPHSSAEEDNDTNGTNNDTETQPEEPNSNTHPSMGSNIESKIKNAFTPSWTLTGKRLTVRPSTNPNSVKWTIQSSKRPWQRPLHQRHRLAILIEHHGNDFALSISRKATLKSWVSKMKIHHERTPPTVRLSFNPEEGGGSLDGIDLEAVTSLRKGGRDKRVDSGFYGMAQG